MPNANEFLEDGGSPELKNNFSKKIFYNHKKILLKSSFDHKKIFFEKSLSSPGQPLKVVPGLLPHPVVDFPKFLNFRNSRQYFN